MRRLFVAMLVMLGLLCGSIFGFTPLTRTGIQCPTAPVRTVAVRDCCNRVVFRAPRPGDRTFVQCRCAEKKAAPAKATIAQKITLFLIARGAPLVVVAPRALWIRHAYTASEADRSIPPALRPPTLS